MWTILKRSRLGGCVNLIRIIHTGKWINLSRHSYNAEYSFNLLENPAFGIAFTRYLSLGIFDMCHGFYLTSKIVLNHFGDPLMKSDLQFLKCAINY